MTGLETVSHTPGGCRCSGLLCLGPDPHSCCPAWPASPWGRRPPTGLYSTATRALQFCPPPEGARSTQSSEHSFKAFHESYNTRGGLFTRTSASLSWALSSSSSCLSTSPFWWVSLTAESSPRWAETRPSLCSNCFCLHDNMVKPLLFSCTCKLNKCCSRLQTIECTVAAQLSACMMNNLKCLLKTQLLCLVFEHHCSWHLASRNI